MNDIMIDIETLGLTEDSVVLTVGIVKFNPFGTEEPKGIHINLDYREQYSRGRVVDEGTMNWWDNQSEEIREAAFSTGNQITVEEGLDQITEFMSGLFYNVWGQGYGFDLTILANLFKQYNKQVPWKFYQERDSRTLFSLLSLDPRPKAAKDTLHNALSDAYYQAIGVQSAYKQLGIK